MTDPRTYYRGEQATTYEAALVDHPEWHAEHEALAMCLEALPAVKSVLDVPVGTGRFFPLYQERGLSVLGIDSSADMLGEAQHKAECLGFDVRLEEGDITRLDQRAWFDLSVLVRLMNLVDFQTFRRALENLTRVTAGHIVVNLRLQRPVHRRGDTIVDSAEQLVRWVWRKARRKRSYARNQPHPEGKVLAEIERLGLRIVEQRFISRRSDASRYYMFLLEK